jgi:hypothetical protein
MSPFPFVRLSNCVALAALMLAINAASAAPAAFVSHPPMRPLPVPLKEALAGGPKHFVDAARGDDAKEGSEKAPWKTLAHASRQLKPGDTLYLRGGTYYEKVALTRSGTAEAPITIASYPGELAVLDGGLREFYESPATSWEPAPGGAEGEFVSTKSYLQLDDRKVPRQFLPASWEPMWGVEEDRPLALGNFGDSLVPLQGYRHLEDLRATSEFWLTDKKDKNVGMYGGPGLWFNRETGRVHIRLAHTRLEGSGDRSYRGETDPRKLPLVISVGFGEDVLRLSGLKHVRLHGLVLRGATGSPMINIYGSEDVSVDHVTVFGGFPSVLIDASKGIHVTNSAFRSLAAPWTSRAHMKYRGTAPYVIVLQNSQPNNQDIEFAYCEITDGHDCAFMRYVKDLQFHHNLVDNFNDDGLEGGPKLRSHTLYIHENLISHVLSPLTQHEGEKDESPIDHDPKAGMYIYRNVFDMRGGTYSTPPSTSDPSGAWLARDGHLAGDHGGPIWTVMHMYHNDFIRDTPTFRDYFLFGLGTQGLRNSERDVFNNIFYQTTRVPGTVSYMKQAENLREGGNILWGGVDGPALKGDHFAKFRASALFTDSRKRYEPGWTTQDRVADPRFIKPPTDGSTAMDLRLQADSAAVNSGQPLPAEWPDPLRAADKGAPDVGALPLGSSAWGIGVDGRIPLFGETK